MSNLSNDLDRFIMISTDGHAGLPPERYKEYLPSKYHTQFDAELKASVEARQNLL